jgi:penicillin-binding protein 1A
VAEYFRQGAEPVFGMEGMIDGGFGMGSDLPLFAPGETDNGAEDGTSVTTSTGETKVVPKKAGFGSMTSGGLY